MSNDFIITLLCLALCIFIGIYSFKRHFAKHEKLKPRMVPWIIISLGSIATAFMLFVHLVNIIGIETGRN
jgi:divalent metal cation (Fe/Co/Zn/Cd) transporter